MINISTSNIITLKTENSKQNRQQKNKNPQNKQRRIPGPFIPWIKRLKKHASVSLRGDRPDFPAIYMTTKNS